jgi:hypothetical protein
LIGYRDEIQSTVEKLIKGAEQLHTTPELNWLFRNACVLRAGALRPSR